MNYVDEHWPEMIKKQVFEKWIEYNTSYDLSRLFLVFTGWIHQRKPGLRLLIVCLNPGEANGVGERSRKNDLEKYCQGDFSLSNHAPFCPVDTRPTPLDSWVQKLFNDNERLLREDSAAIYAYFFRSKGWRDATRQQHYEKLKGLCALKVKEIVDKSQPQRILILAWNAYDLLQEYLHDFEPSECLVSTTYCNGKTICLAKKSKWSADYGLVPIFATAHLRTPGMKGKLTAIRQEFQRWLAS